MLSNIAQHSIRPWKVRLFSSKDFIEGELKVGGASATTHANPHLLRVTFKVKVHLHTTGDCYYFTAA